MVQELVSGKPTPPDVLCCISHAQPKPNNAGSALLRLWLQRVRAARQMLLDERCDHLINKTRRAFLLQSCLQFCTDHWGESRGRLRHKWTRDAPAQRTRCLVRQRRQSMRLPMHSSHALSHGNNLVPRSCFLQLLAHARLFSLQRMLSVRILTDAASFTAHSRH